MLQFRTSREGGINLRDGSFLVTALCSLREFWGKRWLNMYVHVHVHVHVHVGVLF